MDYTWGWREIVRVRVRDPEGEQSILYKTEKVKDLKWEKEKSLPHLLLSFFFFAPSYQVRQLTVALQRLRQS